MGRNMLSFAAFLLVFVILATNLLIFNEITQQPPQLMLCSGSPRSENIPRDPPLIPSTRKERFPSMEERVRVYMSDWYVPPCPNNTEGFVTFRFFEDRGSVHMRNEFMEAHLGTSAQLERMFAAYQQDIIDCTDPSISWHLPRRLPKYCKDVMDGIVPAMDRVRLHNQWNEGVPLVMHLGDKRIPNRSPYFNMPHIKKFRHALSRNELYKKTKLVTCHTHPRPMRSGELEPIVWKLEVERHYGQLGEISKWDTPWAKKKQKAVFRGRLTGYPPKFRSQLAVCFGIPRCHFIYLFANHSREIDAKFTNGTEPYIGNVSVVGEPMRIAEMLEHKAIIVIEGNDVATSLKWALLSESVVLMPPPTCVTFAMEDLLEPWVHYVPLEADFSDVDEKMQWVMNHDYYAQQIARRATLWIQDLLIHPDAEQDNLKLEEEILKRYHRHFRLDTNLRKGTEV